jgi:phosphatidylserine/phosphatidylglycerophosphate/cardiolipin synthase-like enzyme
MGGPTTRCTDNIIQPAGPQWFVDYLPVTGGNKVKLYVDGESYGKDLHAALSGAQSSVMMTGLHFDPDWGLIRSAGGRTTLLDTLQQVPKGGRVQIHLIVNQFWRDEKSARDLVRGAIIKSGHLDWYLPKTINLFDGLKQYPNVHCRADVHLGFIMSTHHQKTVIIDGKSCFLGGIDLTAVDGDRRDQNGHTIPASAQADLRNCQLPEKLWHDVHCQITKGPAVQYVLDNFHARWNFGRLFKNLAIRIRMRVVRLGYGETCEYPEEYLYEEADDKRTLFPRLSLPGGVYQNLTSEESGAPLIHSRRGQKDKTPQSCGQSALSALQKTRIQIVRSMPEGGGIYLLQRPAWNLGGKSWERSAKDAYLVGIRAARTYIYLENQWVADEQIWEELCRAVTRNRDNLNFRVVMVLPRNPLWAAGLGTNQDIDLGCRVAAVAQACKDATQFGMYCIEAQVPGGRQGPCACTPPGCRCGAVGLSEEDVKKDGKTTAQIYVHSKVMIVDDKWSLIGSANSGGISLEGMSNPAATYRRASPDTELSAVIYDEAFAKGFRESLWKEHLKDQGVDGKPVHQAADLFRARANASGARVRFATYYAQSMRGTGRAIRHVDPTVVEGVRASASIVCSLAAGHVPLAPGQLTTFTVRLRAPASPAHELLYRWSLRDSKDKAWLLRAHPSGRVVQDYSAEYVAYLPPKTAQELRDRFDGWSNGRVLCRVMITPVGVRPRASGKDQELYSFLLELPVRFDAG